MSIMIIMTMIMPRRTKIQVVFVLRITYKIIILIAFVKSFEILFTYNSKELNVVHRTRMTDAMMTGGHVVQGATETSTENAANPTVQIQVSSPVKENLWLTIVKQFAIHAKVSFLTITFRFFYFP